MRRLIIIGFLLLGFGLRLHHIDSFSFWLDEGATTLRASYPISQILGNGITLQEGTYTDTHPALYYLVIKATSQLWGQSDFAYRYTSALAGLLLIPFLYLLGQKLANKNVGIITLLLGTINPLQIVYAQEARMYTLLIFLATAASYTLWQTLTTKAVWQWLITYFILMGLAIYTNYTAVFLFAFHTPFILWRWWQLGWKRPFFTAISLGIIGLITLPFITPPTPFLDPNKTIDRLGDFQKIYNDLIYGFGIGTTLDWGASSVQWVGSALALLLIYACYQMGQQKKWRHLLFLLSFLLAPALGFVIVSLSNPLYLSSRQLRHIMVGSPAFILLIAMGIYGLWKRPFRLPATLTLLLLLITPSLALNNLHTNPSLAKDNFRNLFHYIDQQAGNNDFILIHSAGNLTLHNHYTQRPDLPHDALPIHPHPANNKTINQLEAIASQHQRIWFVTGKPTDGRDDNNRVSQWLSRNLTEINRHAFHGTSAEVGVIGYATTPQLQSELPAESQPLTAQWANLPNLLSLKIHSQQPINLPTLWLDLFWQGGHPPLTNIELEFGLRTSEGKLRHSNSQPFRWRDSDERGQSGEWLRLSYGVPIPVGTPPGGYELVLRPWNKATGERLGDWVSLSQITIAPSDQWQYVPRLALQNRDTLQFENGLKMVGFSVPTTEVRLGHHLPLTLYWQGITPEIVSTFTLELVAPDGEVVQNITKSPIPASTDTAVLTADTILAQTVGLSVPAHAVNGRYTLRWSMMDGEDIVVNGRPTWRPWHTAQNNLSHINVLAWPLITERPNNAQLVEANFGETIQLYGYQMSSPDDDTLNLTLFWLAHAQPAEDYFVFIHFTDPDTHKILAQSDRFPANWLRPTSGWRANEIITDHYSLQLPPELPAGNYKIRVGLYNGESGVRLPSSVGGDMVSWGVEKRP